MLLPDEKACGVMAVANAGNLADRNVCPSCLDDKSYRNKCTKTRTSMAVEVVPETHTMVARDFALHNDSILLESFVILVRLNQLQTHTASQ
ncbi:hypothetical protein DL93DRAFT_827956 [Clavulina sp. PMI_390]|nr:hypothetical protein DL93DRAFT_827956 [Clavulina sp. PMI_390]